MSEYPVLDVDEDVSPEFLDFEELLEQCAFYYCCKGCGWTDTFPYDEGEKWMAVKLAKEEHKRTNPNCTRSLSFI